MDSCDFVDSSSCMEKDDDVRFEERLLGESHVENSSTIAPCTISLPSMDFTKLSTFS